MTNIFIAGHNGMVGGAIHRLLLNKPDLNLITVEKDDLDLRNQAAVSEFFSMQKIDQVYLCAAKVGGIFANDNHPVDFLLYNLQIQNNVLHSAYLNSVQKLLFLGSSCIYPRDAQQPMKEDALLMGALEKTNEAYAVAKIAGIKLCESFNRQYGLDFRAVMPTNLYGPRDNFDPYSSHVIPGLIRRMYEAHRNGQNSFQIWGSGDVFREFLYVDDLAKACILLMDLNKSDFDTRPHLENLHINVGSGAEIRISRLAELVKEIVGFRGSLEFDNTRPDGPRRKYLDCSNMNHFGWRPSVNIEDGLDQTYRWFQKNIVG